jgi:hypothetical protein
LPTGLFTVLNNFIIWRNIMFMKTIKKLGMTVILAASATTANAGFTQLDGTIVTCVGLCSALSSIGNAVTATVFLPDADAVYQGTDLNGLHTPNIELEGNFSTLDFIAELYTDAGTTPFGLPTLPALPTAPGADTEVTVTGGAASGIVSIAGVGSTTSAPVWGIFDLDLGTFDAYLFTTDTDGDPSNGETPGHVILASGTFTVTPVPVPAAAWLMMSGLVGLAGARARSKK